MPNEIAYYDDENGNRSYFADDTAREQIADKVKKLNAQLVDYTCTSTSFEYTGANVTCPSGHTYIVRAQARYGNAQPTGIMATNSSSDVSAYYNRYACEYETTAPTVTFMLVGGETAYIWGRWATANKKNSIVMQIVDITN